MTAQEMDRLAITTVRMLAVDAIQQANSGHPGLPLGAAPMAYVLWSRILRHNPRNPQWPDRDRFILSAGHGSALLYALLHLFGYDLSLDEVKNFRQLDSLTPGHPEYGTTPGVEATTGPLGQGFAMGVGMAWAERLLGESFNRPGHEVVNHHTFALVSDGDLMEGISSEAGSFAGHQKLGKLVYLYDDNRISIEGSTDLAFGEDVAGRFTAFGWQVLKVADGEDLDAIEGAIRTAMAEKGRPSLICVRTQIGHGSPRSGSEKAHGEPLGEVMAETRAFYGWPEVPFHVPDAAREHFSACARRGAQQEELWHGQWAAYQAAHGAEAQALQARLAGEIPADFAAAVASKPVGGKSIATRASSGEVLNALAKHLPALVGGSGDLAPSNKSWMKDGGGRNIHFGVRELGMGGIANGIALHGGFIPYVATFLVFSDYLRPTMRIAALMGTHVIYLLTHDSVAVGEDGPTHQPVEHAAALRAIPGLTVVRPADANETADAWQLAVTRKKPLALLLSRQNLPILAHHPHGVARGAYVKAEAQGPLQLILIATGSEVALALEAQRVLTDKGIGVRVVSMPSWEIFAEQDEDYRAEVLPPEVTARVSIEAGSSFGWRRHVGDRGVSIAIDDFGLSGPGEAVLAHLGFNVDHVVNKALALLEE